MKSSGALHAQEAVLVRTVAVDADDVCVIADPVGAGADHARSIDDDIKGRETSIASHNEVVASQNDVIRGKIGSRQSRVRVTSHDVARVIDSADTGIQSVRRVKGRIDTVGGSDESVDDDLNPGRVGCLACSQTRRAGYDYIPSGDIAHVV